MNDTLGHIEKRVPGPVVVVGAGPAGSVTALLLARAGLDVLLLDRAAFPRDKACGECLSAAATLLLDRLGLLDAVLALAPARLDGWRIHAPNGTSFTARFADLPESAGEPRARHALALPRRELDLLLLQAAAAAGARVRTGLRVTGLLRETDGAVRGVVAQDGERERAIDARLVVGADGLRSRVARLLGAPRRPARLRKLSLTAHLALDRDTGGLGEMHVGDGVCVGLAPVDARGRTWNVTVVADADRFGRAAGADSAAFFAHVVKQQPALFECDILPGELLGSGPFDFPVARVAFDGAVLVGDAAGYFDPFTGQGVYHAMAAAESLASDLAGLFTRERARPMRAKDLAPYARAHATLTRGSERVQRLIDAVLSRPALANRAIAAIARRPRLAQALIAVTGDLRAPSSLLSPAFAARALIPSAHAEPA